MANNRINMRKVRELLRLCVEQEISARQGARVVGIGKTAASQYVSGFKASGITLASLEAMSDTELLTILNLKRESENLRYNKLLQFFPQYEKELKRTGVTLQLLWEEYCQAHSDGYGYSQFCHHYYLWRKVRKVSMHVEHKAGDKMYVDFTGEKLSYVDPLTGEIIPCEVFVSVLGSSQLSYIEATASQTKADWIAVNQSTLRFYGGVTAAIVPDCLKSAVTKADYYEPVINETYADFAEHYGTVIIPARALHPQDKALAENFVRNAYTQIFARLRNQIFFSLEELNEALWEQLDAYNRKNFQSRDYSRQQLFEEIEKQYLRPLPLHSYEMKTFCENTVQFNHHIYLKEDRHYYSVPHELTGKKVKVTYTNRFVEIYFNNLRVASHHRDRDLYGYTTKPEHRPPSHRYVSEWTPERFIKWGKKIAPEVEQLITLILESRPHPEQAYKSCMGLLGLEKDHELDHIIKACRKALQVNCITYRFVKNTLTTKAFNLPPEEELTLFKLPDHENIRGKEKYN